MQMPAALHMAIDDQAKGILAYANRASCSTAKHDSAQLASTKMTSVLLYACTADQNAFGLGESSSNFPPTGQSSFGH